MRNYRRGDGTEAIWFDDGEIDKLAEHELRRAKLLPAVDAPVVDIERFIERYLKVGLDQHAELPDDILGVTEFVSGKPPRISINRDLTNMAFDDDMPPPGSIGRFRATLAHEAAHVLLHRSLFEFADGNMGLFGKHEATQPATKLHRCLHRQVSFRTVSDWREVQANQGMAGLLMPKSIFSTLARAEVGTGTIPSGREDTVAAVLASKFEVSKQAARIRLATLGFVTPDGQKTI